MTCNSSMALRHAAIQGAGIACLPTYVVSEDILEGRLNVVAPEYRCTIAHTLYAMYFRSKYINPVIRSFIDFLGEVPPWDVAMMERYPSLIPRSIA
ncbi:LysR family transcriptional regulator [Pandoraea terrae]|uniref:LysR family transcriptional regulator n=1 Tax=Pandoraea terrae TaxID=1537710 RepID=A0A5E4VC66_9BURK|nr:LysR family transcriptional regulator [Pandoraea terrae]